MRLPNTGKCILAWFGVGICLKGYQMYVVDLKNACRLAFQLREIIQKHFGVVTKHCNIQPSIERTVQGWKVAFGFDPASRKVVKSIFSTFGWDCFEHQICRNQSRMFLQSPGTCPGVEPNLPPIPILAEDPKIACCWDKNCSTQ